ncbi:snurportin-1 [Athalia rosae]|uniref:snurportin-1 n=1 Tax=Athalia rosae TaxID=37344 RepID=UPI0020334CBF|nr:snurportin-1 [Athalia rosae]
MASNFLDFSVSIDDKITANSRAVLYKKPTKKNNLKVEVYEEPQEIRRQRLLFEQKKNRDASFNAGRGLLNAALQGNDHNDEEMDVQQYESQRHCRQNPCYANQLMMSEWMMEIPPDLSDKWWMVPCPLGRRVLLIACKGATRAYSKRGIQLGKFSTALPGGTYQEYKRSCTILDCIWVKETKTYYVLDVLAWSNQPLLNCDTEFRFFWLQTRLEETQGLKERGTPLNSYPILPLPNYPCNSEVSTIITDLSTLPIIDGLLFYHKDAHYTHGRTPLVTWLKPFMLPDIFGVQFPPDIYERPTDYVDIRTYIQQNTMRKKKKNKHNDKQLDELMETANMGFTDCETVLSTEEMA